MNIRTIATIGLVSGSFLITIVAAAAGFQDKQVEQAFKQGTLRLTKSMFGKGVSGGEGLNQLYKEEKWEELAEEVLAKKFVSDLYYFYLARAAEERGHSDAALQYYNLAIQHYNAADNCSFGFDSCRGINLKTELQTRRDNIINTVHDVRKTITALNMKKAPLAGVRVEASPRAADSECVSDNNGACTLSAKLKRLDPLFVSVSKPRHFPLVARFDPGVEELKVTLLAYTDMFCDAMFSPSMALVADKIEQQVARIFSRAAADAAAPVEICVSEFKKSKYMSVKLNNRMDFNDNLLTSYAIGARVFDEVVKKMLQQVSTDSADLGFDGYDITVHSQKKAFTNKDSELKVVDFRFYFPKQLVNKYAEKDISGQQLLDGSIILLNGDRVDLKLQ